MDMYLEAIGIIGGLLFLFAFLEVATNKWNGKSFWYEACNAIAAILLIYYAIEKKGLCKCSLKSYLGYGRSLCDTAQRKTT